MKKRITALGLVAALAVTSLVGCGCAKDKGGSASNAKYKVGVVQYVQHEALDAATEGFKAALKDKLGDDVEIDVQNASGESTNCATISNTFVSDGVDLIMANATPALQSAVAATGDIPILGTSVTDYATALSIDDFKGATGINVSGTSDLAPLDEQANMLEELFPASSYSKVGIVYCTAEANSKYQAVEIKKELEKKGYSVTDFTFTDSNDVASVTTTACAASDVIYIPTDNTAASCAETIGSIVMEQKIPVVAGEEGICQGCGVATLSISYYDLGYATGLMAYEILANKSDVSKMDIQYSQTVTREYNADFADKLGLVLPEEYVAIEKSEE